MRIATFVADVTPPIGAPLCDALVKPAETIDDPLSARGIVLLGAGKPIVLCAVDWVGIGNTGNRLWRESLAAAAGTTADRVAVHTLHQHDAPGCDFASETLLAEFGMSGKQFDPADARRKIKATADAVRASLPKARSVTHVGFGRGRVKEVASNRRVLGPDGKVKHVRFSSCRNPDAIAAPEGTIDPDVRLVAFYDGAKPLVSITYYATHPQSYYGNGAVSADFVGAARALREQAAPEVFHVHFNGAGGNVAAGKYNDGSPENRPQLAARLADGMRLAWDDAKPIPIAVADVGWKSTAVVLPPSEALDEEKLLATLADRAATERERIRAARDLTFLRRCRAKDPIDIGCLRLGDARILHMPGELFVEYQLASQAMRKKSFVAMAAYGDYGSGYIGTKIAYTRGGYETSYVSRVAPEVESVLNAAMQKLLTD
ncbi:MAG: hypothetical protein WD875_09305 [Pirellulales bacterium]